MKRILVLALTLLAVGTPAFYLRRSESAPSTATLATPSPSPLGPSISGNVPLMNTYRVEPGEVEACGIMQVCGTFKLVSDPHGLPTRRGGGCLLHQSKDQTIACSTKCDLPGGYAEAVCLPESQRVADAGTPGASVKTCWYRASEDECIKSKDVDLPLNQEIKLSTKEQNSGPPYFYPNRYRWRVGTCQSIDKKCVNPRIGKPWEAK